MSAADREVMARVRGLQVRRGGRWIFDQVNLDIRRGQVTAIMGPSGSGKTTLLRVLGGQLRPSGGLVEVEGLEVPKLRRSELYALRRRMGVLFQSGALFTHLSVFENVAFPIREHTRLPEPLLDTLVLLKLEAVGLRGARALMPAELSGGMARRVALARAIALDPVLIMYDEPFAGQDPITMGVLVQLIRRLNDILGLTTVLVSHDVEETLAIADYVYLLADGRLIAEGTPEQLRASEAAAVRQFIDASADGPVPFHYPAPTLAEELRRESRR
ncbi:phospholipid ABC transporter ATP-binding protein MlaF [Halorhodospira abdelmalekii]|uniref:ABC transporter ATP-binding protein n=1 Tax=Halorhodospira abdelmalekii TaxID=421629 RepID=UPI001905D277|nr:ATP-binding cassette domain-containing protein [Halorhodospira abdelmalekii]MBK1734088.1 phospholipid ABC transporter ATP-binding protein MlaF [Halorhodospira abdelmalekii]